MCGGGGATVKELQRIYPKVKCLKLIFNSYIDGAVRPNTIYHMQHSHCAILMLNEI